MAEDKFITGKARGNSIAFVAPFAYPLLTAGDVAATGGAERQFFLFARGLEKRGWDVSFITSEPDAEKCAGPTVFPVHYAHFSYLGGPKWRMPKEWLSLWRAMKRADSDYYVLKVPGFLLTPMSVFCKKYKRRLAFWAQMPYDADPSRRRGAIRAAGFLQDWGLKRADVVIAQTEDQKKDFQDNFGIRADVVPSICDRLDAAYPFRRNASKPDNPEIDVLWAGNTQLKKRQEVFFKLAKILPHRKFAIALSNSDPSRFECAMQDAENLPNVRFLGTVPSCRMEGWFKKVKILINTSDEEGFPNTFLQAWMNRVPVISLGVDPDDIIGDFSLGEVVGREEVARCGTDYAEMAGLLVPRVEDLLSKSEKRKAMGIAGENFVRERHASSVAVSRLINVLTANRHGDLK